MRILAKACTILVVSLVTTQAAQAIDPSLPFVAVSVPQKPLYLGEVYGPALKETGGRVVAHVVANCPYHISASFSGLRHQASKIVMSPKHLTASINGKPVAIGAGCVPIVSKGPTPRGGVNVPIDLQVGVKAVPLYPAGQYSGTLVLKVTAGH